MDRDGHVKLVDLGFNKERLCYGDTTNSFCGTPDCIPPEVYYRMTSVGAVNFKQYHDRYKVSRNMHAGYKYTLRAELGWVHVQSISLAFHAHNDTLVSRARPSHSIVFSFYPERTKRCGV